MSPEYGVMSQESGKPRTHNPQPITQDKSMPSAELAGMYSEIILDCYRHPANHGALEQPDATAFDSNPSCGDQFRFDLAVKDGVITDVKFSGKGCAISTAACSMLTEEVKGKQLGIAKEMNKEKILSLLGISISPMRLKCALLGLKVFKMAAYPKLGEILEQDIARLE